MWIEALFKEGLDQELGYMDEQLKKLTSRNSADCHYVGGQITYVTESDTQLMYIRRLNI